MADSFIPPPWLLRVLLSYDPESGQLKWRVDVGPNGCAGDVAGGKNGKGYIEVSLLGKKYKAHRVAWAIVTGHWPADQIDHINGTKDDNSWVNLRQADNATNCQNARKARANNKCGFLGVYLRHGTYRAVIWDGKKSQHLGCYTTPEEAHAVYLAKKREMHGGCTI